MKEGYLTIEEAVREIKGAMETNDKGVITKESLAESPNPTPYSGLPGLDARQ